MSKLLIACGGTGGHLAPGIAVAEELTARGHSCLLVISKKQVDSALISKYEHLDFIQVPGRGFSKGTRARFQALLETFKGIVSSWLLLRRERPDLVFAFGGFISASLGIAAKLRKVPLVVHEANCTPGKSTRLLAPYAMRVYLPEDVSISKCDSSKVRDFGYPVRKEIAPISKEEACSILKIPVPEKLLVVIGGSQGAQALNSWLETNYEAFADDGISSYCITGMGQSTEGTHVVRVSDEKSVTMTRVQFSNSMGALLSAADLVISRAGAGSLAEIKRCQTPSILIPYPFAADDHQAANADAHVRAGGGICLDQNELNVLKNRVELFFSEPERLQSYANNLKSLNQRDAAVMIAEDIETLCSAN